jgi:hypothetical protein
VIENDKYPNHPPYPYIEAKITKTNRKERPRCRELVMQWLEEGYTLDEIINTHKLMSVYWRARNIPKLPGTSDGVITQAKKMKQEWLEGKLKIKSKGILRMITEKI